MNFSDLYEHTDKPVLVYGGGKIIEPNVNGITIGCNHHHPDKDYVCFLDLPWMLKMDISKVEGIKITKWPQYSDITMDIDILDVGDTGIFAAWVGCYFTTGPVYLLGMNYRARWGWGVTERLNKPERIIKTFSF